MLDDVLDVLATGTFDAALDRNDDRDAVRWAALFVGTVLAIGGIALVATGRPTIGIAVLLGGLFLFGLGI